MLRTRRLDDDGVAKLKAPAKRVSLPDPECRGHYIRITPNGTKSYWAVARDPSGKQHWQLIGSPDSIKIEDARDKARKIIRSIRTAVGGEVAKDSSFEGVALDWFEMVRGGLRSQTKVGAFLRKNIIPAFAGMEFVEVRSTQQAPPSLALASRQQVCARLRPNSTPRPALRHGGRMTSAEQRAP